MNHRVAIIHNRYRQPGGEERFVESQVAALTAVGWPTLQLQRDSAGVSDSVVGHLRTGANLISGGGLTKAETQQLHDFSPTVVHAHNIHPTFGHSALSECRNTGAAVVFHAHNYRLFCAVGTAFRDGTDCFACGPRKTWNGFVHNCRENRAEGAAYALGIGIHQPALLASIDLVVTPTQSLAADLSAQLGGRIMQSGAVGQDAIAVLRPPVSTDALAARSTADQGSYGLFVGRVTQEKGIFELVDAAAESNTPVRVAGDGPALLAAQERALAAQAPVEFLGSIDRDRLRTERAGAGFAVVPSIWREVLPFAAVESLAAGLPLIASDVGGLADLTTPDLLVARGDIDGLGRTMQSLLAEPSRRLEAGERALSLARSEFTETAFIRNLSELYDRAATVRAQTAP